MDQTIMFWVFIAVGLAFFAYATIGRLCSFHRPIRWVGGGYVSFAGELSFSIFVLCCGLAVRFPAWVILAPFAFLVLVISERRSYQQYAAQEDELRRINSSKYPGVFDNPPPNDIDSTDEDELDLFDVGACTYLGRVSRKDIKAVIDQFKSIPEQGPNDIYMLEESLVLLSKESVSKEFKTLLEHAFEKRDFLELRWMPLNQKAEPIESESQVIDRIAKFRISMKSFAFGFFRFGVIGAVVCFVVGIILPQESRIIAIRCFCAIFGITLAVLLIYFAIVSIDEFRNKKYGTAAWIAIWTALLAYLVFSAFRATIYL